MEHIVTVRSGKFRSYEINLFVNTNGDDPRRMRVGEAIGASKCILCIESEQEIDDVINRLLEIRKEFTNSND